MDHFQVTRSLAGGLNISLLVAALACGTASPVAEPTASQWYRAYVATEGGDQVPFLLELPATCEDDTATIANGEERIPVECERSVDRVLLAFPVYGTRVSAEVGQDGALSGYWVRTSVAGRAERMPFGASPIAGPDARERFVSESAGIPPLDGSLDASGVWRMTFESHGPAKGNFTQVAPGIVEGTVEMPSEYGDLRFLAGNLDGAEVSLSAFDGGYAYLVRAHVAATGAMEGFFVCCDGERDRFTAQRSGDFDVVDPLQQVRVTSASRRVDFEPLLDPKYTGKAAILEIFGTWCPNCNDLAPLLTELYRSHHDEGLEMLGVAYEVSDSEEANQLRLDAYRAKHGLEWEVVIADTATEDLFASSPVSLSPIEGVPVTIFLNRDRTIHAIYAGFRGPATGAAHQETVERFRSLTREILDSPDPAS